MCFELDETFDVAVTNEAMKKGHGENDEMVSVQAY